jgi:hypothetical protein
MDHTYRQSHHSSIVMLTTWGKLSDVTTSGKLNVRSVPHALLQVDSARHTMDIVYCQVATNSIQIKLCSADCHSLGGL